MKNRHLISGALAVLLLLTGCGGPQGNPMGLDEQENVTLMTTAAPATVPTAALPDEKICDFRVETEDGRPVSYDPAANSYTISSGGTYDCWGSLYEGRLLVDAEEDAKVTVNLNGCTITCSAAPPVEIVKADKVEISAKKDTQNRILDLREMPEGAEEDATGGAILSDCDLTIKGNGQLEVVSNYNNGIHTKDDLVIKNLTLLVSAVNNGLKGNDSVTIESGNVTVISTGGDGIKTTSSDLNNNGIQRGSVEILGGNVTVYAACDGIDSASDVTISGDGELNLYTDAYSPYSGDAMVSSGDKLYLRMDSVLCQRNYSFRAYFYDNDGNGVWVDMEYLGEAQMAGSPQKPGMNPGEFPGEPWGGRGGMRGEMPGAAS